MLDTNLIDLFLIDAMNENDSEDSSEPEENESSDNEIITDSSNDDNTDEADDTDDELVQNIVNRQNAQSTNPQPFRVSSQGSDISFHPDNNILCIGDLTGHLTFYNIDDTTHNLMKYVHNDSIRSIDYFPDGTKVASVSSDNSFYFVDIQNKRKIEVNTDEDINSEFYVVKMLNNEICVTGHEAGNIIVWDARVKHLIKSIDCSDSAVNYIYYSSNVNRLYLTTDNGELVIYDVRNFKNVKELKKSEPYSSELTCCTTIRNDRNIVCGTGQGHLLLYDYDIFELESYKPNNSKKEILCMVGASENIVITGNECGKIHAYYLYPNQPIGLIGAHDNWDINRLEINYNGNLLASLAEDEIKFWDISFLEDVGKVIEKNKDRDKASFALPSSQIMSRQEFFSDLNEQESEDDNDDDE